jgi:hypothetical protein
MEICECDYCLYGREGQAIIAARETTISRLQQERDQLAMTLKQVVQECRAWKNRSNMMTLCSIKRAKEREEAQKRADNELEARVDAEERRYEAEGQRAKAQAELEALRTAQVTHHCANCEQTAREPDEALDGYKQISQGLQGDVDEAHRLVARCYLALRFLHDAGAIRWLDPGELAEYEAHAVTPEDLEQLPWLAELADVMLGERCKNAK